MGLHAVTQCGAQKTPEMRENSPRKNEILYASYSQLTWKYIFFKPEVAQT